MKHVIL